MKAFLLVAILFIGISSCNIKSIKGSNVIVEKTYDLKNFNSLDLSSSFDIDIVQSDSYSVELYYNENLEEYIKLKVENNTLIAELKPNYSFDNLDLHLKISTPHLNNIDASGACNIHFNTFKSKNLSFDLSGASEIKGKLIIDNKLSIEASGASDIQLSGKAAKLNLDFSGASEFNGKRLKILKRSIIESSGASEITINSDGPIDVNLSGASSFTYYGKGKIENQDISGVSSIKKG